MRAFHTLRTRNELADFELFTLILSALEWRRFNGEIFLCTDTAGKNFLDAQGLSDLWDGLDTTLDEIRLALTRKFFGRARNSLRCRSSRRRA